MKSSCISNSAMGLRLGCQVVSRRSQQRLRRTVTSNIAKAKKWRRRRPRWTRERLDPLQQGSIKPKIGNSVCQGSCEPLDTLESDLALMPSGAAEVDSCRRSNKQRAIASEQEGNKLDFCRSYESRVVCPKKSKVNWWQWVP